MKERFTLVISDFHLGAGRELTDGRDNFLEDFFHDHKSIEFLDFYSRGRFAKAPVELVVDGDFFNHLQVFPDEPDPECITEAVALTRTEAILDGHRELFDALVRFAQAPHHRIRFMIGNHDVGLFWPSVQRRLVERLGPTVCVHERPVYLDDGVWIEHGNQRVAENWIDFDHPFLDDSGDEPIINLPWGDLFVIKYLNRVKRSRPYIDKVYPFGHYLRWALLHDTLFALRASAMGLVYFFGVLLGLGENRRFSRKKFLKIAKEFSFPVKMDRAAKRIFALNPGVLIVVFGHGHRAASVPFAGGRHYFNTGIWNEMISLDVGSIGRRLVFTFVEIWHDREGRPHGRLCEWHGAYHEVEEMENV